MQIDNQSINELLDQRLLQWHAMQDKRKYLGASMIGDECIRKVQLQYLGKDPMITAKQVRTFDIGHHLEELIIHWLRIAGFYVIRRDDNDEQFDFATARAVAHLRELSEYCLPFVKVGGYFVALKGYEIEEELEEAKKAIKLLGGQIVDVKKYEEENKRSIIIIKKISQTPPKYPRMSAEIKKQPSPLWIG